MQDDREQQIRDRAYSIWEEQGRPQGEDMRHWLQAWQEISKADLPAEDADAMTLPDSVEATAKKPAAANARHGNGAMPPKASRKKKS